VGCLVKMCIRPPSCSPVTTPNAVLPNTTSRSTVARVCSVSVLILNAAPPFNFAPEHFGSRDRLPERAINGSRENRHLHGKRMFRRGVTYGPPLPRMQPDGGVDRGIATFIICASLVRQCEFALERVHQRLQRPRTWRRTRPDLRTHCGTSDYTVPKRPIRTLHKGLPAITTLKSSAYFLLPGVNSLRYLASLK
jgi:hypothetical protein